MRNFGIRTKKTIGSAMAVAALGFAVPVAAAGTAQADPSSSRVTLSGTVSCGRFENAVPERMTVTPRGQVTKAVNFVDEETTQPYLLAFTGIPATGLSTNVRITCVDIDDGTPFTYGRTITISRPAVGIVQSVNFA
ncbi:hypothetical protein [Streptomyces caelestis]|uniref:hypothetical protein n=1 Tax=Streptomyces caelestis TaxID=36816 RepID=UPI0036510A34